jgi:hypothetical protein
MSTFKRSISSKPFFGQKNDPYSAQKITLSAVSADLESHSGAEVICALRPIRYNDGPDQINKS